MSQSAILAFENCGTKLLASVTDIEGNILYSSRQARPNHNTAAESLAQLIEMGQHLSIRARSDGYALSALGFGFGGLVHRTANHPYLCMHEEGWQSLDAVQILEDQFQVPVIVENDCKVAALAEAVLGAGRGAPSVFYFTIGTDIGGGFVRNGQIVQQHYGGESEIGHVIAETNGLSCGCGGKGCVEALCSGPGMVSLGDGAFSSSPAIFDAWFRGDPAATLLVNRCASHLARAIAAVMALLHPSRIVVGGGVSWGNPRYIGLIAELTQPLVVSYFRDYCELRLAELGEHVVSQGAALFAISNQNSKDHPIAKS